MSVVGPSHHFGKKRNLVAIGRIAGMDGPFACPHRSRLTHSGHAARVDGGYKLAHDVRHTLRTGM
jgi:hypothetical protein